ncbi:MAG: YEATS-associated helix-containing protein [Chitinophagaceae bacterium]|nr:YEATS-associated helix-containing protein [Chitinophagaceae bacterium]
MTHIQLLITIIIGAGLLGGLTNYFLAFKLDYKKTECWINFAKSMLLSLCASITVPLFLQILSNNLIDEPSSGSLPSKNYFILAGFCVIAAIFSKRFLEDLYSKVKNLEKKTAENEKEIQDNVRKTKNVDKKVGDLEETMEDVIPTDIKDTLIANRSLSLTDELSQKLISSLYSSKYSFRTVQGISGETGMNSEEIQKILLFLSEMGFAEKKVNYKGVDIWRLLKYPIKIYSASYGVPGSIVDVTMQIQQLVANGVYEGVVLPSTLRVSDPAPNLAKTLKIHCRIRGRETELSFIDGEKFRIL